jgi:hypothetical protein
MRMPIVAVATQPARDEASRGTFPHVRGGYNVRSDLTWREHTNMIAASNANTTWTRAMPPGSISISRPSDSD